MPLKTITKRSNPIIRRVRSARDGREESLLFCEGEKLIQEAIKSRLKIRLFLFSPDKSHLARKMLVHYSQKPPKCVTLSTSVMNYASDLSAPPGMIALVSPPPDSPPFSSKSTSNPLILILHRLQLPLNIGGLMRTAEGAGVHEVWLTENSCDPYSPKSLRGSMGSVFRLPVRTHLRLKEALEDLHDHGVYVVAAHQEGRLPYDKLNWNQPIALALGPESDGFHPEEIDLFSNTVFIPTAGELESLNVNAAGAVCLFESARQRRRG